MDPLVEMQPETWEEIRNVYRKNLPKLVNGVCLLDLQLYYPALKEHIQFNLYCPFGDINNGLVAITLKNQIYQLTIQPLETLEHIEKALAETSVIDWTQNIMVPSATPELIKCLQRLQKVLGVEVHYNKDITAVKFFLPGDSPQLDITRTPANTYVSDLKPEDINIVNDTWEYKGEGTYSFFETLLKCGLTWVLYSSVDQKPLAWVTVSESGFVTHLFCLKPHRKKGYAEHIVRVATNELLAKGINAVAFVLGDNIPSQNLFIKLGYKRIDTNYWAFINKV